MARSSKYKRRPLIPFGDIMLPVIGLVGLGLLIFGIKMFFVPGSQDPDEQYQQVMTEKRENTENIYHEKSSDLNHNDEFFIAVPVVTDNGDDSLKIIPDKKVTVKVPKRAVPVAKNSEKKSPVAVKFKWYVQVGAFKEINASNNMKRDVISKGFRPVIKKSRVNGTVFYKVLVPGGNTRDNALKIGIKLANLGYPYFLFKR